MDDASIIEKTITRKFIIVEPQSSFRNKLKNILEKNPGFTVTASLSKGTELSDLPTIACSDVIMLNLQLPDMDSYSVTEKLMWKFPFIKVIAISKKKDTIDIRKLIETGFKGCIYKENLKDNLSSVIETVLKGEICIPKRMDVKHKI
jgi:DNA-binding NarL/FixJ family response regulator